MTGWVPKTAQHPAGLSEPDFGTLPDSPMAEGLGHVCLPDADASEQNDGLVRVG